MNTVYKYLKLILLIVILVYFGVSFLHNPVPKAKASNPVEPLLQQSDLTYLGAFRLSENSKTGSIYGFAYTLHGIAYNSANNSLFLDSHVYEQKTAEISIPQIV